ncbi:MAG: DUF4442 domain-containing protein [Bacteroidetes bacterium]|nr:DUF4442 domain-containing protein [Bacteroidota bacterium]
MRVLDLPFTKRLGITKSELKPYLLRLQFSNENTNHIGTIHGSASYSLAEITSGYFLNTNFADIADDTLPILRNASIKYKKVVCPFYTPRQNSLTPPSTTFSSS